MIYELVLQNVDCRLEFVFSLLLLQPFNFLPVSFACNFQDWGCVILREINFLLKICWSIPCLHPSWKVHIGIIAVYVFCCKLSCQALVLFTCLEYLHSILEPVHISLLQCAPNETTRMGSEMHWVRKSVMLWSSCDTCDSACSHKPYSVIIYRCKSKNQARISQPRKQINLPGNER